MTLLEIFRMFSMIKLSFIHAETEHYTSQMNIDFFMTEMEFLEAFGCNAIFWILQWQKVL